MIPVPDNDEPGEQIASPEYEHETTEDIRMDSQPTLQSSDDEPLPMHPMRQETRSGNNIANHGDHTRIIYNYNYYRIVRDAEQRLSEDADPDEIKKGTSQPENLITENLQFGRQNIPQFDERVSHNLPAARILFETEGEISNWYYRLDEYEQCYVQAVAILHGAQAQEIYKRMDALYRIVQQHKQTVLQQPLSGQNATFEAGVKDVQSFIFPRKPRLTLQEKTYTTTRRVNGAERLFWEDVDDNGQSSFGSRVLTFISKEFLSKGEHWKNFLEIIRSWSSEKRECSWRAGRALGVILWHQDVSELRNQANLWAKKQTISGRRVAASMLDGAREIEYITQQDQTNTPPKSVVLDLLHDWDVKLHTNPSIVNISVGCAAANAYSFVGKKSLDIESALHGVDSLLAFKQVGQIPDTRALFAAGVAAYVNLTWAGHLREVVNYLATIANELVHNCRLPKSLEERRRYRLQREARLEATFEAFFLVTAAASPKELTTLPDAYTQPLPAQIDIPDLEKRDIILTALLTKDTMQTSLHRVLSAAIISNIGQNRKVAFDLIRQWIETVIMLDDAADPASETLYQALILFLVDLGKTLEGWCSELTQRGYRPPKAYEVYIHRLEQWHEEGTTRKRVIGTITKEVLRQSKLDSAS
jgi:hypothetical protein